MFTSFTMILKVVQTMNSNTQSRITACFMTAALITACGGGSGDDTIAGIDGTGSPNNQPSASATAYGTVTGFGSVFVNGVRFETDSAEFDIDGTIGTQNDLAIGDVVLVVGTLDSGSTIQGTATSVIFDDAVEGPVQSIDETAGTLVVLGQTVQISADTSFDDSIQPQTLTGILLNDIVEVAGLRTSDGSIEATRIELKPASTEFETTGVVSNLDATAMTFNINALLVDYSSAMLNDFSNGMIDNGDVVEAKGGITLGSNSELIATRVERKAGQLAPNAGDRAEIEGFITRFVNAQDFDVSGFPITTNNQTVFEGGTAADIGLDIKIEAEGEFDANGVLVATRIDIRRSRAVRLEALIDSVNPNANSFVSLDITIKSDTLTRIEDKSDADIESFSVNQLVAGNYVEVRGVEFPAGSGEILASLVEREDIDTETELQGFVQSVAQPEFTILGVTITTNSATVFRDAADNIISASDFFAQAEGRLVKAEGTEVSIAAIIATEVEFEIE